MSAISYLTRALDDTGDWTFGQSLQNYLANAAAIQQNIQTRLYEVMGDCFFNLGAGINPQLYFQKNILALDLAVRGIILGTPGVVGISSFSSSLGSDRNASFVYTAVTIYGAVSDQYVASIQSGA